MPSARVMSKASEDGRKREALGLAFDDDNSSGEEHLAAFVIEFRRQAEPLLVVQELRCRAPHAQSRLGQVEVQDLLVMHGVEQAGERVEYTTWFA